MPVNRSPQRLDDTAFVVGWFRRRAQVKRLAQTPDPDAASALVAAVDRMSPSARLARAALMATSHAAWLDRLWTIWADNRQSWLGDLLLRRAVPHSEAATPPGVLSRLKLGLHDVLDLNASTTDAVVPRWKDCDERVQAGARVFAGRLRKSKSVLWTQMMLVLREYEAIGAERASLAAVVPFLDAKEPLLRDGARAFRDDWLSPELAVLMVLAGSKADSLPLDKKTALLVAGNANDADPIVKAQASAYVERVFKDKPDFSVAFALGLRQFDRITPDGASTAAVLRLLTDTDHDLVEAGHLWLGKLHRDQKLDDLIVAAWIDSDDAFLFNLIRDQKRLPSDGGQEALLHLMWGDAKGYGEQHDTEGKFLAQALTIADAARRAIIIQTIQNSRDGQLSDQLRRASLGVQGVDQDIGLKALLASGDEDRIVDAARDMTGRELFALCRRWIENGRRPGNPKKRAVVELAVAALKDLPAIEIEPAPPLPAGLTDLFDVWASTKLSEADIHRDLGAEDPLVRARALYLGSERGIVDQATLRAKAGSVDWPERFVAALRGEHSDAGKDHVYWVAACAGEDRGAHGARVTCGVDEFDRAHVVLGRLKGLSTPLARRDAAEWSVVQSFRDLFGVKGHLDLSADDSPEDKTSTTTSPMETRGV